MATATPEAPQQTTPEQEQKSAKTRTVTYRDYVDTQLRRTRNQVKWVEIIGALATLSAAVMGTILLVALFDHWVFPLGTFLRWTVLIGLIAGTGAYLALKVVPLFIRRINTVYAAHTIEEHSPTLKNSLVNLLMLRGARDRDGVSRSVLKAVESQAANGLTHVPVEAAVDRSRIIKLGYVLLGLFMFLAAYALFSPKSTIATVQRIAAPWADIDAPTRVIIAEVTPGDTSVFGGEFVEVEALIDGIDDDEPVTLYYSTSDRRAVDRPITMTRPDGALRHQAALPQGTDGLQEGIEYTYYVAAGDARSQTFTVTVNAPPRISVTKIEYEYPAYTKRAGMEQTEHAGINALEGTRVTITAEANQEIDSADIDFNCDGRPDIHMVVQDKNIATATFALPYLKKDNRPIPPPHRSYQITFTNKNGDRNARPVRNNVDIIPDMAPQVNITQPQEMVIQVPVNSTGRIDVTAEDQDFALTSVEIQAERDDAAGVLVFNEKLLAREQQDNFARTFVFSPEKYSLKPGDVIRYWAVARDNRHEFGDLSPNVSRSATDASAPRRIEIVEAIDNPNQQNQDQNNQNQDQNNGQNADDQNANGQDGGQDEQKDGGQGQDDQGSDQGDQGQDGGEDHGSDNTGGDNAADQNTGGDQNNTGSAEQSDGQQGGDGQGENNQAEQQSENGNQGEQQNQNPLDKLQEKAEELNKDKQGGENQQPNNEDQNNPGEERNSDEQQTGSQGENSQQQENAGQNGENANDDRQQGGAGSQRNDQQQENSQQDQAGNQNQDGSSGAGEKQSDQAQNAGGDNSDSADQSDGNQQNQTGGANQQGNASANEDKSSQNQDNTGTQDGQQTDKSSDPRNDAGQGSQNTDQDGNQANQQDNKDGAGSAKDNASGGDQGENGNNPKNSSTPGDPENKAKDSTGEKSDEQKQASNNADEEPGAANNRQEDRSGQATGSEEGGVNKDAADKPKGDDDPTQAGGGQDKRGESGAGQNNADGKGAPKQYEEQKTKDEKNQEDTGNEKASEKNEAPAGSTSKGESDSKGEDGDRSGGGGTGGGQQGNDEGSGGGGSNTDAEEGANASQTAGSGETGDQAGDDVKSEDKTGNSGEEKGQGSGARDGNEQRGDGTRQDGPQQGDQDSQENNAPPKDGEGQPNSEAQPGEQNNHQSPQEGAQDSQGNGKPIGGGNEGVVQGPRDGELEPGGDDPDLNAAKKAADMVLNNKDALLENYESDPDLQKIFPDKDALRNYLDNLQQQRQLAEQEGDAGDIARNALRSMKSRQYSSGSQSDEMSGVIQGANSKPPAEYAETYRAFSRARRRGGQ